MIVLESLLEIIKYIIPALVVYLLMRQYAAQQANIEVLRQRSMLSSSTTSMRLQSYERLILLVERIGLVDVLMRLDGSEITIQNLSNAMLVTIQKEYEHNLTQQIYISSQLWEMISLLKDESLGAINDAAVEEDGSSKNEFRNQIYKLNDRIDQTFGKKVRAAIRKEVELYFK